MLNNNQIKLVQTAVKAAGIRRKKAEARYRLLLGQYKRPDGSRVTSCKQLNNSQLTDMLAICEAHGWRCPDKEADHFRKKAAEINGDVASFAQQSAIKKLAGDLGWNDEQLNGMLKRATNGAADNLTKLSPRTAYNVIEALKSMLSRQMGKNYSNLKQIQSDMEVSNVKSKIG